MVSRSFDSNVFVWNMLENKQEFAFQGHLNLVNCVFMTSNNRFAVSGSRDKTVRVLDLLKKRQEVVFRGHIGDENCIAISRDNRFYFRAKKNTLWIHA